MLWNVFIYFFVFLKRSSSSCQVLLSSAYASSPLTLCSTTTCPLHLFSIQWYTVSSALNVLHACTNVGSTYYVHVLTSECGMKYRYKTSLNTVNCNLSDVYSKLLSGERWLVNWLMAFAECVMMTHLCRCFSHWECSKVEPNRRQLKKEIWPGALFKRNLRKIRRDKHNWCFRQQKLKR